jgi:putative flippase GtrA
MTLEIRNFVVVGVISNLINFLIFYFVYRLLGNLIFATIIGYCMGLLFSYLGGFLWVFRKTNQKLINSLTLFIIVYTLGGVGMSIIVLICFENLYFDHRVSWLIGAIFATFNNFFGQKYIAFRTN